MSMYMNIEINALDGEFFNSHKYEFIIGDFRTVVNMEKAMSLAALFLGMKIKAKFLR